VDEWNEKKMTSNYHIGYAPLTYGTLFKIFKQLVWLYNHDSQIFKKKKESLRTRVPFYRFFRYTSGSSFEKTETDDSGEKNSKNWNQHWNQPPLVGY